ncbi:craniofacial development protein 2-like [Antedon mediterranea]|uniref:craniofacial development protein 2-like n=1 Tax=Antedon mediterranea TaxID=105859 RepID=UPI003AF485FE
MYGVAIAIKQSPHIKVSNVHYVYERLMAIDVTIKNCKLRILSAYSPTESGSESPKDIFYAKLSKVTRVENNTKLLLMGDFNATSTITTRKSLFDGNLHRFQDTDDISNDNGTRLINYCSDFKLCILNTWFDHPNVHRITWHSNDGVTKKTLDYNICDHWLRKYVTDTRVYNN